MDALSQAGGITSKGSLRAIEVHRGEQTKIMDLYLLLAGGKLQGGDFLLRQGDVVFVPYRSRTVSIRGAIQRPAIFEMTEGETLGDLIDMAGGFTP
jgi:protein involved in polysaccharide export with SLBB domain